MTPQPQPPTTTPRERNALLTLARAFERDDHGERTVRAGRIVVLLAWIVAVAALLVLLLAWPGRSLLELGFLGLAIVGAWLAGVARFFVLAGAQWPVLSRYVDRDAVRRDAAALAAEAPSAEPASPLARLWRWHVQADLMTRLKRLSLAGLVLFAAALLVQMLVLPRALAMFHPARGAAPGQVTVLTTRWCPYCADLRTRLRAARLPFAEVDVESGWRESLALQATGRHAIPTTLVGAELLPRGLTSQLQVLQAACLQHVPAAGAPAPDCRMLDPHALVRARRENGTRTFEVVPRPATVDVGDETESGLPR
ncbi:glutaredoxin family protein [Ramlibacter algicola]|uniref:Glutaredoxin domain-containing protein n=1 Tax=Ramlibacter algicola TaxID=2795217 RepID=A0A934Q642_9BURK|nr:glutaredoxin domain-containing protein [Ramlibacter algicola]MBK0394964.1 hypothetical protein [Ramlibacter algicola]